MMVIKYLLVLTAVLCWALPIQAATVSDPSNDATNSSIDPSPDIASASVDVTGTSVTLQVRLAPGSYNATPGVGATSLTFGLDTDEDPDTGHPGVAASGTIDNGVLGVEYILRIVNDGATLFEYTGPPINRFAFRRSYPVTTTPNGPDVVVPLADLGGDDGSLHFKVTSSAQVSASGFTGILDIAPDEGLAPGNVDPLAVCPPLPPQVDLSVPVLDVAMKWCCLAGAPACDNPALVGETTVRDVLLRRHQRASQCIWSPQCNIVLRSAAVTTADLEGQFAQLADPDTTIGNTGDVVLCLPQQNCPGQTEETPQPDLIAVWDVGAGAWGDVTKGVIAVSVNRIVTPNGTPIARGLAVTSPTGNLVTQPWLLLSDPTHIGEPNERTLAAMVGQLLTLPDVTAPDNLLRPLTPGLIPGVMLTPQQCEQARNYLNTPEGMVLDPPRAEVRTFADQVYDGLDRDVKANEKYLDVVNSVVIDSGTARGSVVFCTALGGLLTPRGPQGQTSPICVAFALDCDNNEATGDNAQLVVPGLDFAGAEFVAELLIDRKSMDVVPVLRAASGQGSFFNIQFEPGAFIGASSNGTIRVVGPEREYRGPMVIPFSTEVAATLSADFFVEALQGLGVGSGDDGRTFPSGLRFQVATSQGIGQPAVDINPPEEVQLFFEEDTFPKLLVPGRAAPGQVISVRVTDMPARAPLAVTLGTSQVEIKPVATDAAGRATFDLQIPADTPVGITQLTVAVDDSNSAVTADGALRLVICPPDLDGNGELNIFDFLQFQNVWQLGETTGDYDGDGELTVFDFLAFQNDFERACP